jgi:Domain of unknown function (DUF929)
MAPSPDSGRPLISKRSAIVVAAAVAALLGVLVAGALVLRDSDDDTAATATSTDGTSTAASTTTPSATAEQVVATLISTPADVLSQIGAGGAPAPRPISGTALLVDGKPRLLYVGAEFCPFCASERWALVQALSRFGSFSKLGLTTSASGDVHPDTPTLSFSGATYTSTHVSFEGVEVAGREIEGNSYAPLDALTADQQALFDRYNRPPYVVEAAAGSIPFQLLGGKFVVSGSQVDAELLQGKTHEEIAQAIATGDGDLGSGIIGAANQLTAAICELTNGLPASACANGTIADLRDALRAAA